MIIHAKDGRSKEIPLEVWQVDIISFVLGLQVQLPEMEECKMSSKEQVDETMDLLRNAIRSRHQTTIK